LDKEDGDVVADDIPVAFFGIELGREASHITHGIGTALAALDSREPHKHRRAARGIRQDLSIGHVFGAFFEAEGPEGAGTTGVDDSFGDALMVEAVDLEG
jgi:hypothetical protein